MTPEQRFAANLKGLREAAGYSQETLGYLAGINRTQIGHYETGVAMPRARGLVKLAGALSTTPSELLAGIHWKPDPFSSGRLVVDEEDEE